MDWGLVRCSWKGISAPSISQAAPSSVRASRVTWATRPDKYRTVLHLYYYEDMTTEEIARLLDRSPATVRSQLMRGRDRLRVLLEEG